MHDAKTSTQYALLQPNSHWLSNLRMALRDGDRKPVCQMICEFIFLCMKMRELPVHYFTSFLYKKGQKNLMAHLGKKEMNLIQEIICDAGAVDILGNKLSFHQYYALHNISLPHLLGYNINESGFSCKDGNWVRYDISDFDSGSEYLSFVLAESMNKSIFIKPITGSCGHSTKKIRISSHFSLQQMVDTLTFLSKGSFLIQDEIIQHMDLGILNDTSLNTIRMDTFKARGKRPEILSAFLRVGLSGSHIDNIQAGGIFVPIDIENGRLRAYGRNKLMKGARTYSMHPDSEILFSNFQLPFFADVKQLALDAASLMPQAMIGWDIAISNHGPVLIEGNARYYDMQLSDIAYGGYRNNPVFQKALALANSVNKK